MTPPRIGTHVTVDADKLSEGNRAYWAEHGGDLAGVVTLRNGDRSQVTFGNGRFGWFENDALLPEAEQGSLWA